MVKRGLQFANVSDDSVILDHRVWFFCMWGVLGE
ncbi:uncharacterized protein METZ01_LOCUS335151 [marine metagenome]|uniref:Uncharacterized protein n=1 Tax=marine metagenome TaxID=408172 RepID=A0A382QB74_9ZZZZ